MPSPARLTATKGRRTAGVRSREEEAIQKAIVGYLRATLPHGWLVHHSRNGGLSKAENGRAKGMGALAGWPDIEVTGRAYEDAKPEGYSVTVFFEVKAPGGVTSLEQRELHDGLRDIGHRVAIVRSIDDVRRWAWNWALPVADATLKRDIAGVSA